MVNDIFDAMIAGVQAQNRRILENIGIHISLAAVPGYANYRYWRDQFYGTGWLSSFWCQRVRPWLMPRHHADIREIYRGAQMAFRQALLNRTIEAGEATKKRAEWLR